jgi:hypothetical protein
MTHFPLLTLFKAQPWHKNESAHCVPQTAPWRRIKRTQVSGHHWPDTETAIWTLKKDEENRLIWSWIIKQTQERELHILYSVNKAEKDHLGDLGTKMGENIKIDHTVMCLGTDCIHLPHDKCPAGIIRLGSTFQDKVSTSCSDWWKLSSRKALIINSSA